IARALVLDLQFLDVIDQFRAAQNLGMALSFLGAIDESLVVAKDYYARATSFAMTECQLDLASGICAALLLIDNYGEAQIWFERTERLRPRSLSALFARVHFSSGFEIAFHNGDLTLARERLMELAATGVGE